MSSKDSAEAVLMVIKRLIKWVAYGFFGFISFIFIFVYGMKYYSNWQDRVQVVNSMNGIELNESLNDVIFKNSDFQKITSDENKQIYGNERMSVIIEDGRVKEVHQSCDGGVLIYDNLNHISCRYTGESIKDKFGSDIKIYCKSDNTRVYFSPKYHSTYFLKANSVISMSLSSRQQKSSDWLDC